MRSIKEMDKRLDEREQEIERLKSRLEEYQEYVEINHKEIERLKEDNEYLNKVNIELSTENNRLNNIINKLEKELKEDYKIWMCNSRSNGKSVKFGIDVCKTHFYNRLQELKGSDK